MRGTHRLQPIEIIGNVNDNPGLVERFNKIQQTIYLNPMALSGNYLYRPRIWWRNRWVPISNTGMDYTDLVYIDPYGNGNIYQINVPEDRLIGRWDYGPIVEAHYNECLKKKIDENLTDEEFYELLYDCKVVSTIYIRSVNRVAGMYPDDIDTLQEQELDAVLPRDLYHLYMNRLYPRLTSVTSDLFINYNLLDDDLFKDCDRLRFLPSGIFRTLTEQRTLGGWFQNSAIQSLNSSYFTMMTKVTNIDYVMSNTGLRTIPNNLFSNMRYIESAVGAFSNNTYLTKIENNILANTVTPEIDIRDIFANNPALRIPLNTRFRNIINVGSHLITLNMLGNVIAYNTDAELLLGLNTNDDPTNAILMTAPSTSVHGLTKYTLIYRANGLSEINNISLNISTAMGVVPLLDSDQLQGRLVIESNGVIMGYDPAMSMQIVQEVNINQYRLFEGMEFVIDIYTESDIVGCDMYSYSGRYGSIKKNIIETLDMEFSGNLPYSIHKARLGDSFNQLSEITNPYNFFYFYINEGYNIDGIFENCHRLKYVYDNLFFACRNHQNTLKYTFKGCTSLFSVNTLLSTSRLSHITDVTGIFEDCTNLHYISTLFFDGYNHNITTYKDAFKNCINLHIDTSFHYFLRASVVLPAVTLESMFENCKNLKNHISLYSIRNCINFRNMYKDSGLDLTDRSLAPIYSYSDDVTKFGRLSDADYMPQFLPNNSTIIMDGMFENCTDSIIYRKLYNSLPDDIILSVSNMFRGLHSPFSDRFVLGGIRSTGVTGLITDTPVFTQVIEVLDETVIVKPIVRYLGQEYSESAISQSTSHNGISYPEFGGSITIDWGDGTIENVTINIRNRTSDIKSTIHYKNIDYYGNLLEGSIDLRNKALDDIVHVYDSSMLGKHITITYHNRIVPLAAIDGCKTISLNGSLPWSRLESLDLCPLSNTVNIPSTLFDNCWVSSNTRLVDRDPSETCENANGALFYKFDNIVNINNGCLYPLVNIRILGPIFQECENLAEIDENELYTLYQCFLSEFSFAFNPNLRKAPYMPNNIRWMYFTYAATNVLDEPDRNPLNNLLLLTNACGVFAYVKTDYQVIDYDVFDSVPNLKYIDYMFMGADITRLIPNFFFHLDKLIGVIGLFKDSRMNIISAPLFPQSEDIKYIDHLFENTMITEFNTTFTSNLKIESAMATFKNCGILTRVNHNVLASLDELVSVESIFEGCSSLYDISPVIFSNKPNLMNLKNALKGCIRLTDSLVSSAMLSNSPMISTVEGMLSETTLTKCPLNMFIDNPNIVNYRYLFRNTITLKEVINLGIQVRILGSGQFVDFRGMFEGCFALEWLYHLLTDIARPFIPGTRPVLGVEKMLENIIAKHTDEEMNDDTFSLVGLTQAIHRPDPSIDTFNMHMMQYEFTLTSSASINYMMYNYNLGTMENFTMLSLLQRSHRLVVDIDGVITGYDKRLANTPMGSINLLPGNHIIKIYTEGTNDIVGDTTIDSDVITLNIPNVDVKLSGDLVVGPINARNMRELTFNFMFNNTKITDITNLNMISTPQVYLARRMFKESHIKVLDLSYAPVRVDYLDELCMNCKNLTSVIMSTGNTVTAGPGRVNAEKMFEGCNSLVNFPIIAAISDLFSPVVITNTGDYQIQLPLRYNSMFKDCYSLANVPRLLDLRPNGNRLMWEPTMDAIIYCQNMYQNCSSIPSPPHQWIYTEITDYLMQFPTYIFTSAFEDCTSTGGIPYNMMELQSISNRSRFDYMFYKNTLLALLVRPIMTLSWMYDEVGLDNVMNIEYMFGLSTNLDIKRIRMRDLIRFENTANRPIGFQSLGCFENIVTYNTDDRIMEPFLYDNPTLAIYIDMGADIDGLDAFTMYIEVHRKIDNIYEFDIYTSLTSFLGYGLGTGRSSTEIPYRIVISRDGDITDYVEYDPDVPVVIQSITLGETLDPDAPTPIPGAAIVRFDIYTKEIWDDGEPIRNYLATVRPSTISDLISYRLIGPMGHSDYHQDRGLLLYEIFGEESRTALLEVDEHLLGKYRDVGYSSNSSPFDSYVNRYSLFSEISNMITLPDRILDPLVSCTELYGPFYLSNFNNLPDGIFTNMTNLSILGDLFAYTKVPIIGEDFLDNAGRLRNLNGLFKDATNVNNAHVNILHKVTELEFFNYGFANSDTTVIYDDLFFYAPKLRFISYTFYNTRIFSIPNTLLTNNPLLVNAVSAFEQTDISYVPDYLFRDKPNLITLSRTFALCGNNSSIGLGAFFNSPLLENINEIFLNNSILNPPLGIFDSNIGLKYINGVFEGNTSLLRIYPDTYLYNVNILEAARVYKNCTTISDIPEDLFATLINCNTFDEVFYGYGQIQYLPNTVFPIGNNLKSLIGILENQTNLREIPDPFLFGLNGVETLDRAFYNCIRIPEIPIGLMDQMYNLKSVNYTFYGLPTLKELQNDLFWYSILESAIGTFENCVSLDIVGKNIFNIPWGAEEIYFQDCFKNCMSLNIGYKLIDEIIHNIGAKIIHVEDMFLTVRTFLNETLVWEPVTDINPANKIGDSKLTHTPPPSTDTTGMNKVGFILDASYGDLLKTSYRVIEISHLHGFINDSNDVLSRIVIEVDGVRKAYDRTILRNEEFINIEFSSLTGIHEVNLYSFDTDVLYLADMNTIMPSGYDELDVHLWRDNTAVRVELTGAFPLSLNICINMNLSNMTNLYNITPRLESYPIVIIPDTLIDNTDRLPRLNNVMDGFFSGLDIITIPNNLFKNPLNNQLGSNFSTYDGLFSNNRHLASMNINSFIGLDNSFGLSTARYMFANNVSLANAVNIFDGLSSLANFYGCFSGCSSLSIVDPLLLSSVNNINTSHMFNGCISLTDNLNTMINNAGTIIFADYMFANTGISVVPEDWRTTMRFVRSMQYMYSGSKLITIPANTLGYATGLLSNPDGSSPIKGIFSNISTLTGIEGPLNLSRHISDITELFANSTSMIWGGRVVYKQIYGMNAPSGSVTVEDSFLNVSVALDNESQLMTHLTTIGLSNAIFTGKIMPSTDTTGMNEFIQTMTPNTSETSLWEMPYHYNLSTGFVVLLEDPGVLNSRFVIKIYDTSNALVYIMAYDTSVNDDMIEPIPFSVIDISVVKIYTFDKFVGFKGTNFKDVIIGGTLPMDVFNLLGNSPTMLPIVTMVGISGMNDNIVELEGTLLDNYPWDYLNLSNTPFKSNTLVKIGNIFDKLTEQTDLSEQFNNCTNLDDIPLDLFRFNPEVTTLRSTFRDTKLNGFVLNGLLDPLVNLKDGHGMFSNSKIKIIPNEFFKYNTKLTTLNYCFEYTLIETVPIDIFRELYDLLSTASIFRNTPLKTLPPRLGMVPTCYEITRMFMNCDLLEPINQRLIDLVYSQTQPVRSINIPDSFYGVRLHFNNEVEFLAGIEFRVGATGGIFIGG